MVLVMVGITFRMVCVYRVKDIDTSNIRSSGGGPGRPGRYKIQGNIVALLPLKKSPFIWIFRHYRVTSHSSLSPSMCSSLPNSRLKVSLPLEFLNF